jgi:signal transduction histidine kinase
MKAIDQRPDAPRRAARWVGLLAAIGIISGLHYATPSSWFVLHVVYQRCYYVPVILAAYWFGVRGGLLAAAASSLAYAPHIHTAWSHNPPYTVSQYAELLVFASLGLAVGLIATRERQLTNRYRATAESLAQANRDLRESGEQLRRAERLSALGEIAAGLAHEIRNPLAGVKGALEIVSSRTAKGTPEAEFSAIATRELHRLEALVQEFLDFARPRPPRVRPTVLLDVARRVAALLGPQAEQAGVAIELEAPPGTQPVSADPEQIEQVLMNVVLNAIQASPRGRRVVVRQAAAGILEVADRGPGVSAEAAARLFEPFFTTKERGTGLGLAISQRIVAAHGGEIRVQAREGGGTSVLVTLPVSTAQPATQPS